MTADRAPPPARSALHGRRTGRPLRRDQAARVARLLPALAIGDEGPLAPDALFPFAAAEIRLEIGFGGGERLAAEAAGNPEVGFIGCEPFRNGLAKMVEHAERLALGNVRVFAGDAALLLDRLPEGALARVDLLYPDPWPKRRHFKRRFVSDETLARLARVLRPRGEFRFATDIDAYAGWTLAHVLRSRDFAWPAGSAADWNAPWPGWTRTRYEAKAIAAGRRPVYLTFFRRATLPFYAAP